MQMITNKYECGIDKTYIGMFTPQGVNGVSIFEINDSDIV